MGRFGDVLLVSGETGSLADRAARRGGALLPDQHRQHAGVQGRAAGRADEARRRRQRPRRARAVRRRRDPGAVRARRRRRAVRPVRRARRWSTTRRIGSIRWPRSPSARSRPSRRSRSSSRCCAPTPTWRPSASAIAPYLEAEPDKTLGVHRRDGHGCAGGRRAGRLRVPDAPGGRQRGARPLPASAG